MSCPTCDHTMHGMGYGMFHCPRCGTTLNQDGSYTVPALVARCREFRDARHPSFKAEVGIFGDPVLASEWERLGISESINTPDNRPKGM